jgi:hypothetical protein
MWRFRSIAVAVVVLASVAGCGTIYSNMMIRQAHRQGSVSRLFDAPPNAVFLAASQANNAVPIFDGDVQVDFNTVSDKSNVAMVGTFGPFGDLVTSSVFDRLSKSKLGSGNVIGKMKDGRPATLWLLETADGQKTEVTLLVGKAGDPVLSNAYFARLAERLADPVGGGQ